MFQSYPKAQSEGISYSNLAEFMSRSEAGQCLAERTSLENYVSLICEFHEKVRYTKKLDNLKTNIFGILTSSMCIYSIFKHFGS